MDKIKNFIIAFRSLLERNKIFFEVIVASTLSFMAIYLSLKANSITESQTKIMEFENTPQIDIRLARHYNNNSKSYDESKWFIYNRNSKLSNFKLEEECSYMTFRKTEKYTDSIFIPISYINISRRLSEDKADLICEFNNGKSGMHESRLKDNLQDLGNLEIKSYIKISFKTVLDKKVEKYYQIYYDVKEIHKEEWNRIMDVSIDNLEKKISLDIPTSQLRNIIINHR